MCHFVAQGKTLSSNLFGISYLVSQEGGNCLSRNFFMACLLFGIASCCQLARAQVFSPLASEAELGTEDIGRVSRL